MTTKIERINGAYSQMRISGLTVSPSPEDLQLALNRLENMMHELEMGRNIFMSYNFEDEPDPNSVTNVDPVYWQMMDTNLAGRLIPDFNKTVPQALISLANSSLTTASSFSAAQNARQIAPPDRMPIGSGTDLRYNKYQRFNRATQLPPNKVATNVMTINDIDDFFEDFTSYLGSETIASFVITVDKGLTLVSSSNNDPRIDYRIQADDNATDGTWQQTRIIITTSSGRVETRKVNFELLTDDTVNNS